MASAASGSRARTLRNDDDAPVVRRKLDRGVAPVGRRLRPEIEHHIVQGTLEAGHDLGLGARVQLVVQAAQACRPARRTRDWPARCRVPARTPPVRRGRSSGRRSRARRYAASACEHQHAGQRPRDQAHDLSPSRARRRTPKGPAPPRDRAGCRRTTRTRRAGRPEVGHSLVSRCSGSRSSTQLVIGRQIVEEAAAKEEEAAIDHVVGAARLLGEAGAAVLVQGQAAELRRRLHAKDRAEPVMAEVKRQLRGRDRRRSARHRR